MACFHPIEAYQLEDGPIVFSERKGARFLYLPCGRCIGCRCVRARGWAIRAVHESKLHLFNSFVTLTYSDDKCPLSLDYSHYQGFMRRVRKRFGRVRFYMCGEYGELTNRPHYHALLFGLRFPDLKDAGKDLYSSKVLDDLWTFGACRVGDVTMESAGYVARYCAKKVTGDIADYWYRRLDLSTGELVPVEPEFGHMSLKPGIGYDYFRKFYREMAGVRDGVCLPGGRVVPPPKYYDRKLMELDSDMAESRDYDRYLRSQKFLDDCSPERLLVRERCAKARESFRRRGSV